MVEELSEYEREVKKKIEERVQGCNFGSALFRKMFIQVMLEEHRQTQADFGSLVFAWISAMAKEKRFDGRNETTIKLCKEIVAACPRVG